MIEYKFEFCIYPLTPEEAERLREFIQDLLVPAVESVGKFMGPVVVEGVVDEEETGG